tara:strand:- start:192 stop:416 length:225 start_codon:yes stop_codon:yes gene_type:complete
MYFEDSENIPNESVEGIWLSAGGTKYNPNGGINYSYREFEVSSEDSLKKWNDFKSSRKLDRVSESLVENCKDKN